MGRCARLCARTYRSYLVAELDDYLFGADISSNRDGRESVFRLDSSLVRSDWWAC
jgi:hypothetical protein